MVCWAANPQGLPHEIIPFKIILIRQLKNKCNNYNLKFVMIFVEDT